MVCPWPIGRGRFRQAEPSWSAGTNPCRGTRAMTAMTRSSKACSVTSARVSRTRAVISSAMRRRSFATSWAAAVCAPVRVKSSAAAVARKVGVAMAAGLTMGSSSSFASRASRIIAERACRPALGSPSTDGSSTRCAALGEPRQARRLGLRNEDCVTTGAHTGMDTNSSLLCRSSPRLPFESAQHRIRKLCSTEPRSRYPAPGPRCWLRLRSGARRTSGVGHPGRLVAPGGAAAIADAHAVQR